MKGIRITKQRTTLKLVEDVLIWIETNGHYQVEAIYPKGALHKKGELPQPVSIRLTGYEQIATVPQGVWAESSKLFHASPSRFDTRMYRANAKGRRYMRERGVEIDKEGKVTKWGASVEAPKEPKPIRKDELRFPVGTYLTGGLIGYKPGVTRQGAYLYTSSQGWHWVLGEVGLYKFKLTVSEVPTKNLFGSALTHVEDVKKRFEQRRLFEIREYVRDRLATSADDDDLPNGAVAKG